MVCWGATSDAFLNCCQHICVAPMVGDMLSVSLLTLVVIPAVYLLWKEHALKHSTEARQDLRKT